MIHVRWRHVLLIVVLVLFVVLARRFMPFPSDFEDSFILHRYAQNGAQGFLYCWNKHGGPVQGMTGLAWVTLISLIGRVSRLPVIPVNAYAGLVFGILTLLGMYAASARRLVPGQGWIAIAPLIPVVFSQYFLRSASNGLETSLMLSLVALTIFLGVPWRAGTRTAFWLGLFTGFSFLVRPDLPVIPFSLFLAALWTSELDRAPRVRQSIALLAATALSTAASLLIAKTLTGTALPLAASLKLAPADLLLGRLPAAIYRFIVGIQLEFLAYLLPLILLALIASVLAPFALTKKYLPIYFACAVYLLYLFTVVPIMDIAFRYQLPMLIGLSFAVLHFFEFLLRSGVIGRRSRALILGILVLLAVCDLPSLFAGRKQAMAYKAAYENYATLGKNLSKVDGIIIASSEAGKLAAYSGQKFLDTVGLNNRFVAENRKKPDYPQLLSTYLRSKFGLPDVYIRPLHPGIGRYAFLEILPGFANLYACNPKQNAEVTGMVVCVAKASGHAQQIRAAIARSNLGIEFRRNETRARGDSGAHRPGRESRGMDGQDAPRPAAALSHG